MGLTLRTTSIAARRIAAAGLACALLLAAGCRGASRSSLETPGKPAPTPVPRHLGTVEIKQYKGERLDPVSDFRPAQIGKTPTVDRKTYRLKVDGLVGSPASYTYDHVVSDETSHTKVVVISCVEGWSVKVLWEGVLLTDLIDRAGPKPQASTVIFHAADGYTTSLPLDYVRAKRILLAYRQNGLEIPIERGFPFQVVAEDKYGYKWCKWVERIELSSQADYRGYWESRGYSNSGDIGGP